MAKKYRREKTQGPYEDALLNQLDNKYIAQEIAPAIQEFINEGGTLEGFMRKYVPVAYGKIASMLASEDQQIAFKAATELLDRAEGKPLQKQAVVYGDIQNLSEKQLNRELAKGLTKDPELAQELLSSLGLGDTLTLPPKTAETGDMEAKPRRRKRLPKTIDLLKD